MTIYMGICKCCKEWTEVVHTFNFFGDPVSVCRSCLNHPNGISRRYRSV